MSGRTPSGRRGVALLASALLHAALLAVLAHFLTRAPSLQEPVVMQVVLAPPLREPPRAAAHRPAPARVGERPRRIAPPVPGPVAPRLAADGDAAPHGPAQAALRGLASCARADLTREAREACEARAWARERPALARLNLDPTGRYAENPEPFLSRRPTKGCRARTTGDVDALGDSGNVRAGVTCVIPF